MTTKPKAVYLSTLDTVTFVEEFMRAHASGDKSADEKQATLFRSMLKKLDMELVEKIVMVLQEDQEANPDKAAFMLQRHGGAMLWALGHTVHTGTSTIKAGCKLASAFGDFLHMATHMVDYGMELNGTGKLHKDIAEAVEREANTTDEARDAMMEKHFTHPDGKLN